MGAARSRYPWIWTVLVATAVVVALAVHAASLEIEVAYFGFAALAIMISGLGSAISASQQGNRIAWLLQATAVAIVVLSATTLVAESQQPPFSTYLWNYSVMVIHSTLVEVALYPILLILFIFPTGHFLTRRWAWAGWLAGATAVAMLFTAAFSDEVGRIYDPNDEYWNLSNPIGFLPSGVAGSMASLAVTVMLVLGVGGVVAMVVRYKRSDLVARQQIKWVVYAAGVAATALFITTLSSSEIVWNIVPQIAVAAIAVAITVAITRYRLFEIDRLISRTISYAIVIGLLAAVFLAGTVWIPTVTPIGDSNLAVAATTLVAFFLFQPLRKRVRRSVDRRFNRVGYEAQAVADRFAVQMQKAENVDQVAAIWVTTVADTLQPESSSIWLSPDQLPGSA